MYHQEFDPPELLQQAIKCCWYNKRDAGEIPPSFEVVPDGYAEIIFHVGNGFSILRNGTFIPLPSPFMIGLLNQPVVFHTENQLEIIGIRCYPWTVFDLLGLQAGKDGVRVFEHPIMQLQPVLEQWINAGKIDQAIAEVKQYFLNMRSRIANNSMLFKAGVAMNAENGNMPVSRVAAAAHATVRTLERNFKKVSGHTVKNVSALMHFEQVRNKLWIDPNCNLAGLSQELRYTDQSHLSREFKRYSGVTPAAFAKNAKKGKQIADKNMVAFVLA